MPVLFDQLLANFLFHQSYIPQHDITVQLGKKYVSIHLRNEDHMIFTLQGSDGKIRLELPPIDDLELLINCIKKGMFSSKPETVFTPVYVKAEDGGVIKAYLPH